MDVLRRLRRRSLAALRKEVEPVDAATLGRFLPEWQGVATPGSGPDALMDAIARLQGAAVPASILEHDVLRSRVRGFRPPTWTRCARAAIWSGSALARSERTMAGSRCTSGTRCGCSRRPPPEEPPSGELHVAIREHLLARGASFWPDLVQAAGTGDERIVLAALWDLVWAGEVTNDTHGAAPRVDGEAVARDPALRARGPVPGRCGERGHRPAPAAGRSWPR